VTDGDSYRIWQVFFFWCTCWVLLSHWFSFSRYKVRDARRGGGGGFLEYGENGIAFYIRAMEVCRSVDRISFVVCLSTYTYIHRNALRDRGSFP